MRYCKRAFEHFEITADGNCYVCCPVDIKFYSIGNIFRDDIDCIWNSQEAQNIRKSVLDGTYKYCSLDNCIEYAITKENQDISNFKPIMDKYPTSVYLDYDQICNGRCIFCRDKIINNEPETIKKLNDFADKKVLPLLKNASSVYINGGGEVFYSEHSKYLVKKISELYPNIKFTIITNGLLCNEKSISSLGIKNKIKDLTISIHAATDETYKKIVRSGSFSTILENLKSISEMKKRGELDYVQLIFVVSSLNYTEMPQFAELAKSFGLRAFFNVYFKTGDNEMMKEAEKYMIHLPEHINHQHLLNILADKRLYPSELCALGPVLSTLQKKVMTISI